jgi:hypothetical protein
LIALTAYLSGRKRSSEAKVFVLCFLFGISLLWNVYEIMSHDSPGGTVLSFYLLPSRAWQFLAGTLLAFVSWRHCWERLIWVASVLVLLICVLGFPIKNEVIARLVVTGLVALVLIGTDRVYRNNLTVGAVFRWFGNRSYSLYLVHLPILVSSRHLVGNSIFARLTAIGLTLVIVDGLFRYLDNFSVSRVHHERMLLTIGALTLTLVLTIMSLTQIVPKSLGLEKLSTEVAWDYRIGDCEFMNWENSATEICKYQPENGSNRPKVLLVGDSSAAMVAITLLDIARDQEWQFSVSVRGACAFASRNLYVYQQEAQACDTRLDNTFNYIDSWKPDVLVVVNRLHRYLVQPAGKLTSETSFEVGQALDDAMQHSLGSVNSVLIVDGFPEFPEGSFVRQKRSLVKLLFADVGKFQPSRRPEQEEEIRINTALRNRFVNRLFQLNVKNSFCDASGCLSSKDGIDYFIDDNHLTVAGANRIKGLLTTTISDLITDLD